MMSGWISQNYIFRTSRFVSKCPYNSLKNRDTLKHKKTEDSGVFRFFGKKYLRLNVSAGGKSFSRGARASVRTIGGESDERSRFRNRFLRSTR